MWWVLACTNSPLPIREAPPSPSSAEPSETGTDPGSGTRGTGDTATTTTPSTPPLPDPVTWTNPVYPDDFPDPFVLPIDGGYLAFSTNTWWANVPVLQSTDLATWSTVGDALPTLPSWARSGASLTWAPGVLDRGDGTWVLYFVARDEAVDRQCIGAATATAPAGPYTDPLGGPLVCQDSLGGSIDPYPFTDVDGARWLLWKNDGNCCGLEVGLWSQPLADDGLSLGGAPTELVVKDRSWEEPLIENPAMLRGDDGVYWLLYSANWWESASYAVGEASCASPAGPCTKVGDGPIFAAVDPVWGPGGEAFFTDHDGRRWLAYHAWTAPLATYADGGARSLRLDPVVVGPGTLGIDGPSAAQRTVP